MRRVGGKNRAWFEEDVATLLRQAGIPLDRNVRHGWFIAEFITRPTAPGGPRGDRVQVQH
jgi:hypothetical protein